MSIKKFFNKNKKDKNIFYSGFSIIEILAVIAIVAIALSILLGMAVLSLKTSALLEQNNQADALAQETMEAARNFRDGTFWNINGLGTLTPGTDYYLRKSAASGKWEFATGTETLDNFTRKAVISNVQRDANYNIVSSGGTNDPDTKKITATVAWQDKKLEISAYFTNWKQ